MLVPAGHLRAGHAAGVRQSAAVRMRTGATDGRAALSCARPGTGREPSRGTKGAERWGMSAVEEILDGGEEQQDVGLPA
jgi:hypothetical protein